MATINNFQKKIFFDCLNLKEKFTPADQVVIGRLNVHWAVAGDDWDVTPEQNRELNRLCTLVGDIKKYGSRYPSDNRPHYRKKEYDDRKVAAAGGRSELTFNHSTGRFERDD